MDLIGLVMRRAAERFTAGGKCDGRFNSASFALALRLMADCEQTLDGKMVEAILCGRPDVEYLPDYHWQIVRPATVP